jgi:hypothetical protein
MPLGEAVGVVRLPITLAGILILVLLSGSCSDAPTPTEAVPDIAFDHIPPDPCPDPEICYEVHYEGTFWGWTTCLPGHEFDPECDDFTLAPAREAEINSLIEDLAAVEAAWPDLEDWADVTGAGIVCGQELVDLAVSSATLAGTIGLFGLAIVANQPLAAVFSGLLVLTSGYQFYQSLNDLKDCVQENAPEAAASMPI